MFSLEAVANVVPISSIAWSLGSVSAALFGIKSYRRYLASGNLLTFYFAIFGLVIGASLACYSFPSFFSRDLGLLREFYLIGDLFLYLGLGIQARILCHIGLKSFNIYPLLLFSIATLGLTLWLDAKQYSALVFNDGVLQYLNSNTVNYGRGMLLLGLLVPIGYFLIKNSAKQTNVRARFKAIGLGVAYLFVGLTTAARDFFLGGYDRLGNSLIITIIFLIFFISLILPSSHKTELKT